MSETVSIDDSVDDEGEPASNIVTIAIFESGDFSIALGREGGEGLEGVTFGEAIRGVTELIVSDVVVREEAVDDGTEVLDGESLGGV